MSKYIHLNQNNNVVGYGDFPITNDTISCVEVEDNDERITTYINNTNEYMSLQNWFDGVYTYKEQKYRRLISLNKLDDDGVDGQTKLNALYEEAEINRARIQELETLLND